MQSEPMQISDRNLVVAQTGYIGMLSSTSFTSYVSGYVCVCVCFQISTSYNLETSCGKTNKRGNFHEKHLRVTKWK